MIEHLDIRNFALIENLSLDLHEGFNVITGETGAGKSIILGALGLLMGERADSGAIRNGAEEITVNAVLSVPEGHEVVSLLGDMGIEVEDNQIVIRRIVRRNGRSVITVQGQSVTRTELAAVADSLVDMHGQSEHQSLLLAERQRRILDSYAGNRELLEKCSDLCRNVNELREKEEDLVRQIEESRRQEDYLNFALEEIENAAIQDGEDDKLKERISVLSQSEAIFGNAGLAAEKLREVKTLFYDASASMARAAKADSALSDYTARIESCRLEAEDIAQEISSYISSIDFSQAAVDSMQERLSLLQRLKRKYGPELSDVAAFAEDARQKLDMARNSEVHLEKCRKELSRAMAQYADCAKEISSSRRNEALVLEKSILEVLKTLGMPQARFEIRVLSETDRISAHGFDAVSFVISANPGEDLKEIKEIASGGELSRIMLAIKTVLAGSDSIETQVFDEIDTGIGGAVALSLADCMASLAQKKQVLAITHLASIASRADTQFVVSKNVENGRTYTGIRLSEGEDRVREIARMLSGDEEAVSLEHARKMLGIS